MRNEKARNNAAADQAVSMAIAALAGTDAPVGVFTDAESVPGWVIVAIARRGAAAAAIVVPDRQYDGMALIKLVDPELHAALSRTPTAAERATPARQEHWRRAP